MAFHIPDNTALWQLVSNTLFVTGALGAMFVEFKIHETLAQRKGLLKQFVRGQELHGLLVICLLLTLLIAGGLFLPVIAGLKEPDGKFLRLGPRIGMCLVISWVLNACFCSWAVLRATRWGYPNRLRFGAASTIALTNVTASIHNYFFMVEPHALSRIVSSQTAMTILMILVFVCLVSLHMLAGIPQEGPLFDWEYIRVRTLGWVVLFLNGFLFLLWHARALPYTKTFLSTNAAMMLPFIVNIALVVGYLRCKETTSASRRMTGIMLPILAIQLIIFGVVITLRTNQ